MYRVFHNNCPKIIAYCSKILVTFWAYGHLTIYGQFDKLCFKCFMVTI